MKARPIATLLGAALLVTACGFAEGFAVGCAHGKKTAPATIPDGHAEVPEQMWSWCTMAVGTADGALPDRPRRDFALWEPQTRVLALPDECDALRESYWGPADVRAHEIVPAARKPKDLPDPWRVLVGEDKRVLLDPARVTWIALSGDAAEAYWSVGAWSDEEDRYLLLRGVRPGAAMVVVQHQVKGRIEIELEVFAPGG